MWDGGGQNRERGDGGGFLEGAGGGGALRLEGSFLWDGKEWCRDEGGWGRDLISPAKGRREEGKS